MTSQEIQILVSTVLTLFVATFVTIMFFKQRVVINDMKSVQVFMSTYTNTANTHIKTLMDAFKPENIDGLIRVRSEIIASEKDKEYKNIIEDLKSQIQSLSIKEKNSEPKDSRMIKVIQPNQGMDRLKISIDSINEKAGLLIEKYNILRDKYYLSISANVKVLRSFEIDINKFEQLIFKDEIKDDKLKATNEQFFKDLKSNLDSYLYIEKHENQS